MCGAGECRNTIGSFVCRCPDGYSVKPEQGPACTDDDECELGTCDCHPAADCINLPVTIHRTTAAAPPGTANLPLALHLHDCTLTVSIHPSIYQYISQGSFQCRCRDGWRGDGTECEDVDECLTNNGGCHPRAACTNTDGSFKCLCETGYKGDG